MIKLEDYDITKKSINNSVYDSTWDSVRHLVRVLVGYSIWNSAWNPIGEITYKLSWYTQGGKYD